MKYLLVLFVGFSLSLKSQTPDPLLAADQKKQKYWVDSIYNALTPKEKVGQLFMPMVFSERDSAHFTQTMNLVKNNHVGGLIFSLGGPVEQTQWLNAFQKASKTPLLIAMDAEWGVAMRLDSVQPFPWPMTLGAIQDTLLLQKIGARMAAQEKRLGIHYSFSPVLDINTNPKNPIIGNRAYGASKSRVIKQAMAIMKGHQQEGILTSGKHFPGHGDTAQDSHKTLPTVNFDRNRLMSTELAPYRALIQSGLSSIMVAHLNVPSLTQAGLPTSLSKEVIQELLIKEMKFKGLVVTDALNMKGVSEYTGIENIDLTAFKAGHDMLLISNDIPRGIEAIADAVERGEISEERLAHSVKKVLKAKFKAGLARYKPISTAHLIEDLNTPQDTLLIAQAMGKALTLLKNKNQLLPLKKTTRLGHLPLGDAPFKDFEKALKRFGDVKSLEMITATNVLEKTKNLDTLVVSFHRSNKTPWKAADFKTNELEILKKLALHKVVILSVFVKPYALSALDSITGIESVLMAYQNSPIAQKLAAEALFGAQFIQGRLPVSVSKKFEEGSGLDIEVPQEFGYATPAEVGFDPQKLEAVDRLALQAIDSMMTPGMQILAARHGKIFYQKNFGFHTYKKKEKVKTTALYDLASLTKILATIPLLIQSVSRGELDLNTTVGALLPEWKDSNKATFTLKEMLAHYARLKPWIPFYKETVTKKGFPKKSFYAQKPSSKFSLAVAKNLFLKSDYESMLYERIKNSELEDSLQYKYSDFPYYILKKYFEKTTGQSYDQLVKKRIIEPLGLKRLTYNPLEKFEASEIVPSEVDTYFRQQELKGYVHDMGAAMQNGVGGHAGLFGNAEAVATLMQLFLQHGQFKGVHLLDSEILSQFLVCPYCSQGNRRGIGFDKPQLEGLHISTCGCVSKESFGHSGYTGTFAWTDPEKELVIVILANRTYPNDDFTFSKSNIRTRLQELFYTSIIN